MALFRRLLALILVASVLLPVPAAHAAVPDGFGIAVWNGAAAIRKSPATTTITETAVGSGRYRVIFPGQGRTNAIAHVTAINSGGRWCQLANWGTVGTDAHVFVDCYSAAGLRQSNSFTVMYANGSHPISGTGEYAYYAYNLGGTPTRFNSAGSLDAPPLDEAGVGSWRLVLSGFGGVMHKGNVQVTALDGVRGARCKASAWWIYAAYVEVQVKCYDSAGAPLDTRWALSYHEKRKSYGAAGGKFAYGTLWWPGTLLFPSDFRVAETNYNPVSGPNTAVKLGTGRYLVTMPQVPGNIDNVQVTALGHLDNRFCQLESLWTAGPTDVQIKVICFAGGQFADSGFFITYDTTS